MTRCGDLFLSGHREVPLKPEMAPPVSLVDVRGKRVAAGGERRLRLALLEDAVGCLQRHACAKDPRRQRLFGEALDWITDDGQGSAFSFENVCDALGLDHHYLRGGLRRWCDQQSAQAASRRDSAQRQRRRKAATVRARTSAPAEVLERCLRQLQYVA